MIVIMSPIDIINNRPARTFRQVKIRRMPEAKMIILEEKFKCFDWSALYEAESAHCKAEILQQSIMNILDIHVPEKNHTFSSDDSDFFTQELKKLDQKRKRLYSKQGRSSKWKVLNKKNLSNLYSILICSVLL